MFYKMFLMIFYKRLEKAICDAVRHSMLPYVDQDTIYTGEYDEEINVITDEVMKTLIIK